MRALNVSSARVIVSFSAVPPHNQKAGRLVSAPPVMHALCTIVADPEHRSFALGFSHPSVLPLLSKRQESFRFARHSKSLGGSAEQGVALGPGVPPGR